MAKRLAIIQADDWRHKQNKAIYEKPTIPRIASADQALFNASTFAIILANGHYLSRLGDGWVRCDQCLRKRKLDNYSLWLGTKCTPRATGLAIVNSHRENKAAHTSQITHAGRVTSTPVPGLPLVGGEGGLQQGPAACSTGLHQLDPNGSMTPAATDKEPLTDRPAWGATAAGPPPSAVNESFTDRPACGATAFATVAGEPMLTSSTSTNPLDDPEGDLVEEDSDMQEPPRTHTFAFEDGPPVDPGTQSAESDLVTLEKALALRKKAKAARAAQQFAARRARKRSWATVSRNLEALRSIADKHGWKEDVVVDSSLASKTHPTHTLCTVGRTQAVYCVRCAAWCNSAKLNKLALPCAGSVLKGTANAFRLLQLGIVPKKGVHIPGGQLRRVSGLSLKRRKAS